MAKLRFKVGDRVNIVGNKGGYGDDDIEPIGMIIASFLDGDVDVATVSCPEGIRFLSHEVQTDLVLAAGSWDSLAVGDILIDRDGNERTVLGVAGRVIFLSDLTGNAIWHYKSHAELKQEGWTIKGAEPTTTELTIADIEQKLEMEPGTLRVKKD